MQSLALQQHLSAPHPIKLPHAAVFVVSLDDHDCDRDQCAVRSLTEVGVSAEHVVLGSDERTWTSRCSPNMGKVPVVLFEGSAISAPSNAVLKLLRTAGVRLAKTLVGLFRHQAPNWDFSSGFDDFVLRPYVGPELLARIERLTQNGALDADGVFATERMAVDANRQSVFVDGQEIAVTAKELEILLFLFRHRGALVSREIILRHAWGDVPRANPRMVDIHVSRLRHKLNGALPLRTIRGRGYKLDSR
jgi:hypothetical protein